MILSILRAFIAGRAWEAVDADLRQVDWDAFRAIARHHRLVGVLYDVAKKSPQFPIQEIESWRPGLIRHGAKTVQRRRQLLHMLSNLKERNVQATPFKGLVLAEMLYNNAASRPTTDFDLYVPFEGAKTVIDYFLALGYKSPYFKEAIPEQLLNNVYSIELYHPVGKEYVDIHWELTDGYAVLPFSREELQARLIEMPFEEERIRCFDDTVTAALIAVHGAKNSWDQLFSIVDLALFFRSRPDFNYGELLQRLDEYGIGRMLSVGAHLVDHFGLASVPDIVSRFDWRSQKISHRIARRIVHHPLQPSPKRWGKVALNLAFRTGLRTKFAYMQFKMQPKKVDVAGASLETASRAWLRRVVGMS